MVAIRGKKAGREWYLAPSLQVLWQNVNNRWPERAKASDGSIASPTHTTINPNSDHEPAIWDRVYSLWVVSALDLTDDDDDADMYDICEAIRIAKDPRIKYVIHFRDGRKSMYSSYPAHGYAPFVWRPYSGSNPHTNHAHFSVRPEREFYNDRSPWSITLEEEVPLVDKPDWAAGSMDRLQKRGYVTRIPERDTYENWQQWVGMDRLDRTLRKAITAGGVSVAAVAAEVGRRILEGG